MSFNQDNGINVYITIRSENGKEESFLFAKNFRPSFDFEPGLPNPNFEVDILDGKYMKNSLLNSSTRIYETDEGGIQTCDNNSDEQNLNSKSQDCEERTGDNVTDFSSKFNENSESKIEHHRRSAKSKEGRYQKTSTSKDDHQKTSTDKDDYQKTSASNERRHQKSSTSKDDKGSRSKEVGHRRSSKSKESRHKKSSRSKETKQNSLINSSSHDYKKLKKRYQIKESAVQLGHKIDSKIIVNDNKLTKTSFAISREVKNRKRKRSQTDFHGHTKKNIKLQPNFKNRSESVGCTVTKSVEGTKNSPQAKNLGTDQGDFQSLSVVESSNPSSESWKNYTSRGDAKAEETTSSELQGDECYRHILNCLESCQLSENILGASLTASIMCLLTCSRSCDDVQELLSYLSKPTHFYLLKTSLELLLKYKALHSSDTNKIDDSCHALSVVLHLIRDFSLSVLLLRERS